MKSGDQELTLQITAVGEENSLGKASRNNSSSKRELLAMANNKRLCCFTTYRQRGITITLLLFSILTPVQFVAAVIANSLALLGDCASLTVDTISYAVNLWAECSDSEHLHRNQFIAIAVSISVLLGITGYVIYDACSILLGISSDDDDVNDYIVFGFSVAGLLFDLLGLAALLKGRKEEKSTRIGDLNLYSAGLHVFADLMRSITTLIESLLIWCFNSESTMTDAWAALIVSALILIPCAKMMQECLHEYRNYASGDKEVLPLIDGNVNKNIKPQVLI